MLHVWALNPKTLVPRTLRLQAFGKSRICWHGADARLGRWIVQPVGSDLGLLHGLPEDPQDHPRPILFGLFISDKTLTTSLACLRSCQEWPLAPCQARNVRQLPPPFPGPSPNSELYYSTRGITDRNALEALGVSRGTRRFEWMGAGASSTRFCWVWCPLTPSTSRERVRASPAKLDSGPSCCNVSLQLNLPNARKRLEIPEPRKLRI